MAACCHHVVGEGEQVVALMSGALDVSPVGPLGLMRWSLAHRVHYDGGWLMEGSMTGRKEIYFVRHGQTEWNAIRRMQGQWNSNLNELGRAQARINGELLANLGIDALFASPLDRTMQTAAIINELLRLPVNYDDRIMEWDCGDWSGHLYDEVRVQWADEWAAWQADQFNYRGPNCENYVDMFNRARPFIDEIMALDAERIAVVSHGMIGKVMVAIMLGLDEAETLSIHQSNDMVFLTVAQQSEVVGSHFVGGVGPFAGIPGVTKIDSLA